MNTLLYIEDDENLARLLARRMERQGFTVVIAGTGEEGLHLSLKQDFDMVLVDYNLPGMSGLDVLDALGKRAAPPPMILLTASGDERLAISALERGAADYAIKDVNLSYIDLLPAVMQAAYTKARLQRENVQQQQELIDARDRAESASQAKTDFLAMMSHEIRTPMNVVVGLADLLSRTTLDDKQSEMVRTLKASAALLLTLINDLLDLGRIESGQIQLEVTPFDFTTLTSDLVAIFQSDAVRKGLSLEIRNTLGDQKYLGDRHRLQQVLVNLTGNAMKFTDSGSIRIEVEAQPLSHNRATINLSVRDSGIGIAPEKLPHIFDKFIQADNTITRRFGGSGLGLTITKALVEAMGGSIGVESQAGQGSTFTLRLPLELADGQQILAPVQEPAPMSGMMAAAAEVMAVPLPQNENKPMAKPAIKSHLPRALLVEDYPANIMVATLLLEGQGFQVESAISGLAALDVIDRTAEPFDVVLMDVQMPDIDGYETTRRLRVLENAKGWKHHIIGVTAHALAGDREKCIDAGMDDYMSKPINPELLQIKLRGLAGRRYR